MASNNPLAAPPETVEMIVSLELQIASTAEAAGVGEPFALIVADGNEVGNRKLRVFYVV